MRTRLFILFTITCSIAFSQVKLSKKELRELSFKEEIGAKGAHTFGFYLDGKPIGPYLGIKDSEMVYLDYNKDQKSEGFTLYVNRETGENILATAKKGKKEGPFFSIKAGEVQYAREADKKGNVTDIDLYYQQNLSNKSGCRGNCVDGFGLIKYDEGNYAFSYFAYGNKFWTTYHIFPSGNVYRGSTVLDYREGMGVFTYDNGTEYIGHFKKGYLNGLGFVRDKTGKVIEKGIYKGGELITSID